MNAQDPYLPSAPSRGEVDTLPGPVLLDFGTNWCGHCVRAAPHVAAALDAYPQVRHVKVEDGPGRPLERSFRVKLWPTLVLLRDGREVARVVRPAGPDPVTAALARLVGGLGGSAG